MENILKLVYLIFAPFLIVQFYDNVVVANWSLFQLPWLAGVPRWTALAGATALYVGSAWMLVEVDLLGKFRSRKS